MLETNKGRGAMRPMPMLGPSSSVINSLAITALEGIGTWQQPKPEVMVWTSKSVSKCLSLLAEPNTNLASTRLAN